MAAKEKEIIFKINGQPAADTIKGIQEQIKALDDTIANSKITDPNFNNLVQESNKAKESLQRLQKDGVEGVNPSGLSGSFKSFGDTLSQLPGPMGGAIQGMIGFTRASLAFIATPVGAIIAAVVIAFQAFQKAVASSEKATFALNKVMGAFSGIIGPIVAGLGEVVAVLLEGVVYAIDLVMSGLEALGVGFAESARDGMQLADTLNQIEEAEGDLEVARAQQNKTLAEAREILSDTNATYEERKKALEDIRKSEEALAQQEVELANKQVAAAKANIRLYGESKENLDKLDQALIKLANTEQNYAAKKRQFNKEQKKLDAELAAAAKQADDELEARRKEQAAKAKEYADKRYAARQKEIQLEQELVLSAIDDEFELRVKKLQQNFQNEQTALKKSLKDKAITQKEFDKQLELTAQIHNAEMLKIQKDFEASQKAIRDQTYAATRMTVEEQNKALEEAESAKWDKLIQDQKDYENESALSQAIFNEDGSEIQRTVNGAALTEEQKQSEEILKLEKKKAEALSALRDQINKDKFAKDKEALDYAQEVETSQLEKYFAAQRDLVLDNQKATATAKKNAEMQYAKDMRDLQVEQLRDQIKLEKQFVYENEEAKKESNLRLINLQKQLNEKLKEQYEINNENWSTKTKDFLEEYQATINAVLQTITAIFEAYQAYLDYTFQKGYEEEKARFEDRTKNLKTQYEADLAAAADNEEAKAAISINYQNAVAEATYDRDLAVYNLEKEGFENGKKVQIAQAIITGIQSAMGAFASMAAIPVVGPVLGAIAAAAAAATAAFQVATIRKTTFSGTPPTKPGEQSGASVSGGPSKFAGGGLLNGPMHSSGGISTPFGELEGGEFVINRQATKSFLPTLEMINSLGSGSGPATNLSTQAEFNNNNSSPIIKTYVVATDVTTAQEANKRIQDIARL